MADTQTTNYGFVKPEVTASDSTWGGKLNGDMDSIDTELFTQSGRITAVEDDVTDLTANKANTADIANALWQTGDSKERFGSGLHTGWVRQNGRTIGDASSGGTELANASAQALFLYLWPFTILAVSSGRGVSAAADWAAHKTIVLPSRRGRAGIGAGTMGAAAASGIIPDAMVDGQPTNTADTIGATVGASTHALTSAENGPHTHTGTTSTDGDHSHNYQKPTQNESEAGGGAQAWAATTTTTATTTAGAHDHTFTTDSSGSGTAHINVQPSLIYTYYIKL